MENEGWRMKGEEARGGRQSGKSSRSILVVHYCAINDSVSHLLFPFFPFFHLALQPFS